KSAHRGRQRRAAAASLRTALVSISTPGAPLDGAWYEPDAGAVKGAALLFHGNTMNFYAGAPRFLPPALTALGLACLAFNRRGRDMLTLASAAGLLARDRLDEVTRNAVALVKAGRGKELMMLPGWWYVCTAESFLDLVTEPPDILEIAPRISCPVLYLRGDKE